MNRYRSKLWSSLFLLSCAQIDKTPYSFSYGLFKAFGINDENLHHAYMYIRTAHIGYQSSVTLYQFRSSGTRCDARISSTSIMRVLLWLSLFSRFRVSLKISREKDDTVIQEILRIIIRDNSIHAIDKQSVTYVSLEIYQRRPLREWMSFIVSLN